MLREVIVGKNSAVWRSICRHPDLSLRVSCAISHKEVPNFRFAPNDRVWVFAYSRHSIDNLQMLTTLASVNVAEIVYVTSSSTIVSNITSCYEYPRAKHEAEILASKIPNCKLLTLGLVAKNTDTLPAGLNAATTLDQLVEFILNPTWPDQQTNRLLFRMTTAAFRSHAERALFQLYGMLMNIFSPYPCLLRPFDFVLRSFGYRWYGYVFLSNKLWSRMTK